MILTGAVRTGPAREAAGLTSRVRFHVWLSTSGTLRSGWRISFSPVLGRRSPPAAGSTL